MRGRREGQPQTSDAGGVYVPPPYPPLLPHVPSLQACSPALHEGNTTTVLCTLTEALLSLEAENVMV